MAVADCKRGERLQKVCAAGQIFSGYGMGLYTIVGIVVVWYDLLYHAKITIVFKKIATAYQ